MSFDPKKHLGKPWTYLVVLAVGAWGGAELESRDKFLGFVAITYVVWLPIFLCALYVVAEERITKYRAKRRSERLRLGDHPRNSPST